LRDGGEGRGRAGKGGKRGRGRGWATYDVILQGVEGGVEAIDRHGKVAPELSGVGESRGMAVLGGGSEDVTGLLELHAVRERMEGGGEVGGGDSPRD